MPTAPTASNTPSSKPRRTIRELKPAERVSGPFAITNAQLGRTRADKPYLRCLISDRTGEVPGRMWSVDEALAANLPPDGFVWIEGESQAYQGEIQIIIQSIAPFDPTPEQLADLMPSAARPIDEMFAELVAALNASLTHPAVKALAELFLNDQMLMDAFKRCPAAKSMHHAYIGGLLEHTLSLVKLAALICPLYPKINRDLVVMGLFLHDLGKTREIAFDRAFTYTDRGELVGHIVEGAVMLRDKCDQLRREKGVRLPPGTQLVLEHIILSHHGVPEFGAAKLPSTPEAIMVSILDNLDAKTTMALAAARPDGVDFAALQGNFTERNWALETKLYRPDPLAGS